MFKRILIANRGEIARRIARTCRRLGIETVAVHSDADRTSAHLDDADGREGIGGAAATDSYLNGAAILAAARRAGCDALHPGHGFLSENAAFAQATGDAGLIFIGPPPDVIAAMGDKAEAKRRVAAAGVPVVPGSEEASDHPAEISDACHRIGYPVILKPVAGGGGKGMTVVRREEDLSEAIERAIRLGRANFADGRLLVERFIANPRHIEVQIFGDAGGRIVHLFERECTLQRNHQKIIEEAPAGALPEATRAALLAAAVRGAEAIGYRNAGTFEFILAPDGAFYFLEVNTRLQVEHPVTEAITGLDLVEWQLRVAAGEALPLSQDEIRRSGHAIECRIYAEDPDNDFQPAPGEALAVRWPAGCRVDAAFDGAGTVPPFYDPMVAKLIVRSHDRADSLHRLLDAVQETVILGLTTNLGFLARLLQDRRVIAGDMDTHLVDRLAAEPPPAGLVAAASAAAIGLGADGGLGTGGGQGAGSPDVAGSGFGRSGLGRSDFGRSGAAGSGAGALAPAPSPWTGGAGPFDRRALDPDAPFGRAHYRHRAVSLEVRLLRRDRHASEVMVDGRRIPVTARMSAGLWRGEVAGMHFAALWHRDHLEMIVAGTRIQLSPVVDGAQDMSGPGDGAVLAPMPGSVVALAVEVGSRVERNAVIAIVEAMKMENRIHAPIDGTVTEISCRIGDVVAAGQSLATIAAAAAPS